MPTARIVERALSCENVAAPEGWYIPMLDGRRADYRLCVVR